MSNRNDNQNLAQAQRDARREWIGNLRALCDLLAADPQIPLPYQGTQSDITFFFSRWDQSDELTESERIARLLEPLDDVSHKVDEDRNFPYRAVGQMGAVKIMVHAQDVTPESVDAARAELEAAKPAKPEPKPTVHYALEHVRSGDTDKVVSALRAAGLDAYLYGFDFDEPADVTVTKHDDGIYLDNGETSTVMRALDTYDSVAAYAASIVRWVNREDPNGPRVCGSPGCEVAVSADYPWCSDTCRSMDLALVGGAL
jgi:hypothetical protein